MELDRPRRSEPRFAFRFVCCQRSVGASRAARSLWYLFGYLCRASAHSACFQDEIEASAVVSELKGCLCSSQKERSRQVDDSKSLS